MHLSLSQLNPPPIASAISGALSRRLPSPASLSLSQFSRSSLPLLSISCVDSGAAAVRRWPVTAPPSGVLVLGGTVIACACHRRALRPPMVSTALRGPGSASCRQPPRPRLSAAFCLPPRPRLSSRICVAAADPLLLIFGSCSSPSRLLLRAAPPRSAASQRRARSAELVVTSPLAACSVGGGCRSAFCRAARTALPRLGLIAPPMAKVPLPLFLHKPTPTANAPGFGVSSSPRATTSLNPTLFLIQAKIQ